MKSLELSIKEFRVKLQRYYANVFSKLKIFNSTQVLHIDNYYQELLIEDEEKSYSEDEIFEKLDKRDIQYLFKGDIGSGKSTFVQYLCYKWSQDNKILNSYRLIIYLRLRNLNSSITNITDLVQVQYRGLVNNFNVNEFIFEYQDEILFIFDGLDEIRNQECRENFYKINQFIENSIIVSRNNSININKLYLNGIFCIKGFKDIKEQIENIYSEADLRRVKKEKGIIKYIFSLFDMDLNGKKIELLRAILYLSGNKDLINLLQRPLFLIFMKNNIYKLDNEDDENNEYRFYSSIIENLILEYNKNIDFKSYNINLERYPYNNENRQLKYFIVDKLSFVAFEKFNDNQKLLGKNLKFLKAEEVNYMLFLGFLKTNDYRVVKENSRYEFINEIFQKYFISQYIANCPNLTDFKRYIQIVKSEEKYDVFAFLNFILKDKKKENEHKILVKLFGEVIDSIEDIEVEIKLLAKTQIEIENLDKKIEEYEKFIDSLDRIKQKILKNKLKKLKDRV